MPGLQKWEKDKLPGARPYNITVQTYQQGGDITVERGCTAFMFTNVGDTIAFVNGMVVFPSATPATALGDSRSIAAHTLDIYKGRIQLKFQGAGVAPAVEIVQVFYTDFE